ncbi:hypothetical protein T492DRAFT_86574 [Pavlovales sp. CCMP2436]|nr:hypothetical protein T492DRAFT_86574 [Pavlovales sp. CCMP2436]
MAAVSAEAGSAEAGSAAAGSAAAGSTEAGSAEAAANAADKARAMAGIAAFFSRVVDLLGEERTEAFKATWRELRALPEDRFETRASIIEELYGFIPPETDLSRELEKWLPLELCTEYATIGARLAAIDRNFVLQFEMYELDSGAPAADDVPGAPAADGFDGAPAVAAAAAAQGFTLRSPADIAAAKSRKGSSLKAERGSAAFRELPQGPFATKAAIAHAFDRHAKEKGHRKPFFTGHRAALSNRGEQHTLCCPFGAKERAGKGTGARRLAPRVELDDSNICPWTVTLERATTGFVILHACCEHSSHQHDEPKELSEAECLLTYTEYGTKIPDQLINLVTDDIKLLSPSIEAIKRFIDAKAQVLKIEITWLYNDVYNLFSTSLAEKEYDATGLVELLMKRKEELGLAYKIRFGKDGVLAQVFFEMEGTAGKWAIRGEENILIFNTTRARMPTA